MNMPAPETGTADQPSSLEQRVIDVLRTCYDPEIPVNIYELGLIYGIHIDSQNNVTVRMTLTSPGCPVAGSLPIEVEERIQSLPEVNSARAKVVWEPSWSPAMMSEAAKLQLGFF